MLRNKNIFHCIVMLKPNGCNNTNVALKCFSGGHPGGLSHCFHEHRSDALRPLSFQVYDCSNHFVKAFMSSNQIKVVLCQCFQGNYLHNSWRNSARDLQYKFKEGKIWYKYLLNKAIKSDIECWCIRSSNRILQNVMAEISVEIYLINCFLSGCISILVKTNFVIILN
jgi:hypothetical protein